MLSSLKINDLAIIEDAKIKYSNGLNVMTGETGSGKSIIIDSINAVRGERSSKDLISDGADCAKVTAVFENVNDDVISTLKEYDIDCLDRSVFIQRTIKDNRNICKVNGEAVTVSILKQIGSRLIDIHGQNDNQTLLNEENHLGYIDKIAENKEILSQYKEKFHQLKEINRQLKKSTLDENEKERKFETLSFQINEIENAEIKIGEKKDLIALKNKQINTEKILQNLGLSKDYLDGSEDTSGILALLYSLKTSLMNLTDCYSQILSQVQSIDECISALQDCASFVSGELNSFEGEDLDINKIEERLDIIYRLSKKYGDSEEEILEFLEKAKVEYKDISLNEEKVNKLTDEYNSTLEELLSLGDKITNSRKRAGEIFSQKIMEELTFLDMPNVKFKVEIKPGKVTVNGIDEVQFLISTNAGQDMKPMVKIASGGELSRIMLAIKCVLTNLDNVDTLIFDEIDTGVSGRAAEKIGYKLKEVSSFSQIICVTHLAQIAAFADNHLFIEKNAFDGKTRTTVRTLDNKSRKNEIARIIGGSHITDATLKSAEEMLERAKI